MLFFEFLIVSDLTACFVGAVMVPSSSRVVLPRPTGRYDVGRKASVEMIVGSTHQAQIKSRPALTSFLLPQDFSRVQPFAPVFEPVKLEISIFYPVLTRHGTEPTAYFPAKVARFEDVALSTLGVKAPTGTFEKLALDLASDDTCQDARHRPVEFPLAIFMPGEGSTRLWYSQVAATIASNGYIVVAIDPPYDVDIVEYADGSLVFASLTLWDSPSVAVQEQTAYVGIETRVQDVQFVLDQLSNLTLAHSLIPNLPSSGLNVTSTAMFGHSLGGATAYSILEQDVRVLGGLDMDGGLFGPGGNGTSKPFMIMGCANHTRDINGDYTQITWAETWPNITGWRRDVMIAVSVSCEV